MSAEKKIRAVLFDMDGVLVDAREWHFEALTRALALVGFEVSREDHTRYDGLPTFRKLELITRDYGLPREHHSFLAERKQFFTMEIVDSRCKPDPLHEQTLAHLKQNGFRLAVCSNSKLQTVKEMLDRKRLLPYLDFYLSHQDVPKPKPDPGIYQEAMRRMGLSPDECLVVEDNVHGILAAKAAGARLMVVRSVEDVNIRNLMNHIDHGESSGANLC